jgi:hypothetical protein
MPSIKHSKYKNPGILFELLIRTITSDTLSGKDSKATNILKKYFVKTELGKEYKLYEVLNKNKHLTEGKAEMILNTIVESSKNLNRGLLKKQKYNLIKEISEHYNLEEFFKTKISNYKQSAALYTLLELYNNGSNIDPNQVINNKLVLLESITKSKIDKDKVENDVLTEFKTYDKDLRILTYKVLLEKFNTKYSTLNNHQKEILKEFINSVDSTPKLKEFYNRKIIDIKNELNILNKNVKDKTVSIKLNEVNNLLFPLDKKSTINNNHLVNLLQYYELLEEIKKTNG